MPGKKYEKHPLFDSSMNHEIIFYSGIIVLVLATIYLLWNTRRIPKIVFIEALLLLIASLGVFYLILKVDMPWPLTIMAGATGVVITTIVLILVKHGKRHKSDN
jgi:vacuolar-type H+-ATPase subunit I/STV1